MTLFILTPLALAQDPAPGGTEGIVQVPEGSVVTPPPETKGKPFTVPAYSYLLPEPMYDQALTKAKQLAVCQPALEKATAQTLEWVDVSQKALDTCSAQFSADAATVETLRAQVVELDTRAVTAEMKLRDARVQRNTAWAITGGIVLGAITVTAVAVSN